MLVEREGETFVPGLAKGGVLQHRGGRAWNAVDVVGAAACSQRRNDRVVVDRAELMLAADPERVNGGGEISADGAVVARGGLPRVRGLQRRIGRGDQTRV